MKTNDTEFNGNIIPEGELKNVSGGTGTSDTKYHIHDTFTYAGITDQRYVIVGIGDVDMYGDRRYILDHQKYTSTGTDHGHAVPGELFGPGSFDDSERYAWVSLGLTQRYESFIDQNFTKI